MVEVRVIPSGMSGLVKQKKPATKKAPMPTRRQLSMMTPKEREIALKEAKRLVNERKSNGVISNGGDYFAVAAKTAKKMMKANEAENNRLGPKQLRKMLRDNLLAAHPTTPLTEIEEMVERNLPHVMKAYMGEAYQHNSSEEVAAVWRARREERRKTIRGLRQARRENQKPSKADLKWMATGRR